MRLQVKPALHNYYPLSGLIIRGASPQLWLQQLELLQVNLHQVPVYALPGTAPNTLWGCFIIWPQEQWKHKALNAVEPCQCLHQLLFIPQYATTLPIIGAAETASLFSGKPHLLHPEIGLVPLQQPVNWASLLTLPLQQTVTVIKPAAPLFIPGKIQRAEIKALPPDEILTELEEKVFPRNKKFNDQPLSWGEKIKLGVLKTLFSSNGKDGGDVSKQKTALMRLLEKLAIKIMPGNSNWADKLEQDLDDLEKRNRTEMQKLMDLFKENPEEALKYAIPLDGDGTTRGDMNGRFEMSRRWNSFDLFGRQQTGRSGGTVFGDDAFYNLQQQYRKTAAELVKAGKYDKAAFMYMKLLKDNSSAAETLEKGSRYAEAAAVYLNYLHNKNKAAICYEKGQMYSDAISLYTELKEFEKTGDLFLLQQKQKEALSFYQLVADEHIQAGRYVRASLLMRNKMQNTEPAQQLLLQGWRQQRDGYNCINNYFENINDPAQLLHAIEQIYQTETDSQNKPVFLTALRHELKKSEPVNNRVTEIAYEIVAELAKADPQIVSELRHFNGDKSLVKDLLRFKAQNRQ